MLAPFFLASPMKRFTPSLFERLFDDHATADVDHLLRGMNIEQMKTSVAGDVEALLNSRVGLIEDATEGYPHARASILTFGLRDFAGTSFESSTDQDYICRSIAQAIERHEPRLKSVSVTLHRPEMRQQLLNFSVSAMLVLDPAMEHISFDAFLQPMTHKYAVSLAGH